MRWKFRWGDNCRYVRFHEHKETKKQDEYLFRFTQKATRKALGTGTYCSLKEAERLKSVPVSGVISWYDVAHDEEGRSLWASRIYLVAPRSGQQVVLEVPPEYPLKPCKVVEAPAELGDIQVTYEKGKNIRGYVKECVKQMDAHSQLATVEAEILRAKHKLRADDAAAAGN